MKQKIYYKTKNYIYELFFIKKDDSNMEETRNDLGSLLDISNYVFGNCILRRYGENMKLLY